jgi:hypothetical protein
VIKLYQPWPSPVQAACYRHPSVLPDIGAWVCTLREQGSIPPDTEFSIYPGAGAPVGVLSDRSGEQVLRRGAFLVFGHCGLRVLDERSFFRYYHEPNSVRPR